MLNVQVVVPDETIDRNRLTSRMVLVSAVVEVVEAVEVVEVAVVVVSVLSTVLLVVLLLLLHPETSDMEPNAIISKDFFSTSGECLVEDKLNIN